MPSTNSRAEIARLNERVVAQSMLFGNGNNDKREHLSTFLHDKIGKEEGRLLSHQAKRRDNTLIESISRKADPQKIMELWRLSQQPSHFIN